MEEGIATTAAIHTIRVIEAKVDAMFTNIIAAANTAAINNVSQDGFVIKDLPVSTISEMPNNTNNLMQNLNLTAVIL